MELHIVTGSHAKRNSLINTSPCTQRSMIIRTNLEKVFVEGVDASSETTHSAGPLTSLDVYHIPLKRQCVNTGPWRIDYHRLGDFKEKIILKISEMSEHALFV